MESEIFAPYEGYTKNAIYAAKSNVDQCAYIGMPKSRPNFSNAKPPLETACEHREQLQFQSPQKLLRRRATFSTSFATLANAILKNKAAHPHICRVWTLKMTIAPSLTRIITAWFRRESPPTLRFGGLQPRHQLIFISLAGSGRIRIAASCPAILLPSACAPNRSRTGVATLKGSCPNH